MQIKSLEKYADNGNYMCRIVNEAGEGHSTDLYRLEALWPPAGQPVVKPAKVITANGTDLTLQCEGSFDQGNPVIRYTIWTKQGNKTFLHNVTGTSLLLKNLQAGQDSGHYQCQTGNFLGLTNVSETNEVTVEALTTKRLTWNDENFELSCTTDGNASHFIWEKDGQPLDKEFFEYLPLQNLNSSLPNNQAEAYTSTIRRNIKEYHFTCQNVEYFNGKYTCQSQSSTSDQPTTEATKAIFVTTQYKAIWLGGPKSTHAEVGERNVSLHCSVCSNPEVESFAWQFDGSPLRNGIQVNGDTISLDAIKQSDYGHYTCTTVTIINHFPYTSTFGFKLEEKGPPSAPKNIRVLSKTSHSVNLTWTPGYDGGYGPLIFKLEYEPATALGGYKEVKDNLSGDTYFLNKLKPGTNYDLRIQAINHRSFDKGPNYSNMVPMAFTTRAAPNISHIAVTMEETNMTVSWKYLRPPQKYSVDEEYRVQVQVEYKQLIQKNYSIFPANGSLLDAYLEIVVIQGYFDIHSVYLVQIIVYENGITDITSNPQPLRSNPKIKYSSTGVLFWVVVGVGLTFAITATTIGAFLFRRRILKRRKPLKLAPSRNELDILSPSIANGPIEFANGPIEFANGPIEFADGPIEIADGPIEIADGPMEFANGPIEFTEAEGYEVPIIPVDTPSGLLYAAVSEVRPLIPTVLDDISDY